METEQTKTIYNLELHEELRINTELIIQRVAGGWNYKYYKGDLNGDFVEWNIFQIVFVRYHNEFDERVKCNF